MIIISNGSPGLLIKNIKLYSNLPEDLLPRLKEVPKQPLEALELARDITERLDGEEQMWIINWMQNYLWRKTRNSNSFQTLDLLKGHLTRYVQPRLAWEVALLKLIENKLAS